MKTLQYNGDRQFNRSGNVVQTTTGRYNEPIGTTTVMDADNFW